MDKQMTETGVDLGKWVGGAVAGALLMYMLDPERGSARRAQSGERLRSMSRQTGSTLGNAWHGAGSRIGRAASDIGREMSSATRPDGAAESASRMGRAAGDAFEESASQVSRAASESAARASRMAGQATDRVMHAMQGMRGDWAPAARGSALLGAGMLGLYGLLRRSPLGLALGLGALALVAGGASSRPVTGMLRRRGAAQPVAFEKTIRIDASPEEVYDLWSNYENFPRFMSHVEQVRDLGAGRSHWTVKGPAGAHFEWDSELTQQDRPQRLAWRSEAGADIPNTGSVEFEPYRGGTLATVRMSYVPPAGMLGHGLATLLGADPKRQMDDDLARMKALVERGALPHDAAIQGKSSSRFLH